MKLSLRQRFARWVCQHRGHGWARLAVRDHIALSHIATGGTQDEARTCRRCGAVRVGTGVFFNCWVQFEDGRTQRFAVRP